MASKTHLDSGGWIILCRISKALAFCRSKTKERCFFLFLVLALIPCFVTIARADTGGSISGTVTDQTGAVVPDATITALNLDTTTQQTTKTNSNGFYTFTTLPVGRYQIEILREGFKPYKRTGLVLDVNAALREDITLTMGEQTEQVVVSVADTMVQVDTVATHLGEVVQGTQVEAIPLNGRSYTDLLSIQPGVSPVTTLTPTSVIMAGVTGTINPSGDANPGDVSIDGQRESANGFMVNGTDVQEHMNGGTSVIPNLDSIDEFRVLTNNFDPEYGNYNGGMINVITKSGSNAFHGDAFEFLRNTILDSKNAFDSTRGVFRQNQFGGTLGGPIRKEKLFFFVDYQGKRQRHGIPFSGLVPTPAMLTGDYSLDPLGVARPGWDPVTGNPLPNNADGFGNINSPYTFSPFQ
jgi:hypothetical protein